jgi:hypothetical protein
MRGRWSVTAGGRCRGFLDQLNRFTGMRRSPGALFFFFFFFFSLLG